jgi:hypothetical protein
MKHIFGLLLVVFLLHAAAANAQQKTGRKTKKQVYEEMNFEDMIHRYLGKEKFDPFEGIYTVSCVITTRNKVLFGNRERIRVVERKDNYARVVILKDWPGSKRDYIEISMSYRDSRRFPIVGELNTLSEGNGFVYKHIEPDGSTHTFSMITESENLIEAEYSQMQKRKTVTYRLSYLKTYPKISELAVFNR